MDIEEKKDNDETLEETETNSINENKNQKEKNEEEQSNDSTSEVNQLKEEANKQIEENKKEKTENNQIDNKSTNDFKPRKWLLSILIIITIGIFIFLVYQAVNSFKSMTENKESWGIFNFMKSFEDTQEQSNEIINKANETQKEIENQRKKINRDSFNWNFETYVGTEYGSSVGYLLDKVITNNKKNKDYLITVIFKDTNTTDPESIKNIKKQFEEWHKYEVSLDYDEEGYANKVTIEY